MHECVQIMVLSHHFPSFINSHMNLSIANKESRLLLRYYTRDSRIEIQLGNFQIIRTEKEHFSVHFDNQTFCEITKLDCPFTSSANGYFRIIGTFNGLICLSDDEGCYMDKIILWNPSLKKYVILPKPTVIFKTHGHYQHSIGFGYLPATNDYKIVRVVYLRLPDSDKVPPEVEIYELSTDSWRNVNAGDFSCVIRERASQAFLNGAVHWAGFYNSENLIVSFDMGSETFGAMMVPNGLQNEWRLCVSTFGESLSLIHDGDNFCCIWVMKEYGVANSWTKLITIDHEQHVIWRPVFFRENGDILLVRHSGNTIFDSGNLVSYDPKSKEIKNLGVHENAYLFYVDTYMESLVLIKGSNEVLGRVENFVVM
ncbi:hypothetical protein LguiB_001934 [Lonicera macranthoides]